MNNSTLFEDSFEFEKYQSKGIAESRRRFKEELPSGSQQYITSKDSAVIVAKGISAFLSIEQYLTYPSLRLRLRNNDILDLENIFRCYFEHCLKFLQNEENKKLFKNERRSVVELVNQHCKEEEQYFTDSKLLFNQVRSSEIFVIEQIKKATIYYPEWVRETYISTVKDNNSAPITFTVPNFSENQLRIIVSRLIDGKIIATISNKDFQYLFTGQKITKTMNRIHWKESLSLAHEFLRRVVYTDSNFNFKQINECFKFNDNKTLDSNNKSIAQYKNDDILDKILSF